MFCNRTRVYSYGFNGKETDDETSTQDYGFRIYNPALGRFLSVDPLTDDYPELTPYQFASNSPIENIDLDGLEKLKAPLPPINPKLIVATAKALKAGYEVSWGIPIKVLKSVNGYIERAVLYGTGDSQGDQRKKVDPQSVKGTIPTIDVSFLEELAKVFSKKPESKMPKTNGKESSKKSNDKIKRDATKSDKDKETSSAEKKDKDSTANTYRWDDGPTQYYKYKTSDGDVDPVTKPDKVKIIDKEQYDKSTNKTGG